MSKHLPIYYGKASSLRHDGRRNYVHPADVRGRFDRYRQIGWALLIALWAALPWLEIGGHPAVFLDVEARQFFLFGRTFNAQDVWLVFFPMSAVGFALIVTAALWGRVWCGYACPHTVFLEAFFRPFERWIEGSRNERLRRNALPWTNPGRLARKLAKHAVYVVLAFGVAHIVVSYFVSLPRLYEMMRQPPAEHPGAFVWTFALVAGLYFNFSWFREQLCLIICPYGRLQSVLTDHDTLVIGYDVARGEPRGKAKTAGAGACVDCNRCVVVCPTGIDIRNGLQIDCIGCARCIDACDAVMDKLERPRGLIRYDSLKGLAGEAKARLLRPRVILYGVLGAVGALVMVGALSRSVVYEANLLRLSGAAPMVVEGTTIRNAFEIHLVNKRAQPIRLSIAGVPSAQLHYTIAVPEARLASLQHLRIPVFVSFERGAVRDGERAELIIRTDGEDARSLHAPLIAPPPF
jgi:cytochrome c oxidase accessory protein FixG